MGHSNGASNVAVGDATFFLIYIFFDLGPMGFSLSRAPSDSVPRMGADWGQSCQPEVRHLRNFTNKGHTMNEIRKIWKLSPNE